MSDLIVRGYACPFNRTIRLSSGLYESVRPGAFVFTKNVQFQLGCHGGVPIASTVAGTARLFQDSYGLGFELNVPARVNTAAVARAIQREGMCRASVNFADFLDVQHREEGVGPRSYSIIRASIDHVALIHDPAYADTAVWIGNVPEDELPTEMAINARRWELGMRASFRPSPPRAGQAVGQPASRSRNQKPGHPGAAVLAKIDALLAHRGKKGSVPRDFDARNRG